MKVAMHNLYSFFQILVGKKTQNFGLEIVVIYQKSINISQGQAIFPNLNFQRWLKISKSVKLKFSALKGSFGIGFISNTWQDLCLLNSFLFLEKLPGLEATKPFLSRLGYR